MTPTSNTAGDIRNAENYPIYRGSIETENTQTYFEQLGGRRVLNGIVDKAYFVFAGIASIWLGVASLIVAPSYSWWSILIILVVWAIFAYLALPRFHRIMTNLYVPRYFIGRTQTSDGLLGDPVNIGFHGESVDLHTSMEKAGWHLAEPVTLASSWRIIVTTLTKKPYPTAPVSPLYLFDRKEDFAYQQDVDGSPEKRHHIRFWKTPEGWKLPGGAQVDWLGAATFDRAVGLSLFTFQVTHKIDAETDLERDYVIDTLRFANPGIEVEVIKDFSTGYHSRNGGGDAIVTDGNLPIVDLHHVVEEALPVPDTAPESVYSHHRRPYELAEAAPISAWIASLFVSVVAVAQTVIAVSHLDVPRYSADMLNLVQSFVASTEQAQEISTFLTRAVVALFWAASVFQMWLALSVIRGRDLARKVILALLSVSFVTQAIGVINGSVYGGNFYSVFVVMAAQVFALLEYTSDEVVNYTHNSVSTRRAAHARRRHIRARARAVAK